MNPPEHLSKEMAEFWAATVNDYHLLDHHHVLLQSACEAVDRVREAREHIDRDGMVLLDRFGQPRPHPMLKVENENRVIAARLLRELGLDYGDADLPRVPRVAGGQRVG